jgi:hypothetical protein
LKNIFIVALVILISACCSPVQGQRKDSLLLASDTLISQFDSLLNSEDSLSLFRLIDQLMQMPSTKLTSQLAIRLGYNSNVVATSRTIGFNQFGLAPGVSYYHKSGLYADASTYWSQQYSPQFYLSVLSAGYLKTATKHWSFLAEYSHYFYPETGNGIYNPYTNNLGTTHYFEFKPVTLRLDYYFYFGQKSANRIMPGLMFNFAKKNWHGIKKINFFPSFTPLFGSEQITEGYQFYPDYVQRYQQNQSLPPNAQLPLYYPLNKIVFGLMNYSFVAPLSITMNDWNFLISYTFNIPKSLPGEDLGLKNGGYVSCSITRYIGL